MNNRKDTESNTEGELTKEQVQAMYAELISDIERKQTVLTISKDGMHAILRLGEPEAGKQYQVEAVIAEIKA